MGLDSYLTKKHYVKNWDHTPEERRFQISIKQNKKKYKPIKPERISFIVEEIGYWRKANHIHKWFVDNVQDGKDDCKEYYVDHSQLEELLKLCKDVLQNKDKPENLLPTKSGFFFGGTEYDEYYYNDLEDTIVILETELNDKDEQGYYTGDVYYRSSW